MNLTSAIYYTVQLCNHSGVGRPHTNYRSAQIHPVSHTFRPPSKSIRFNVNLQEDDGLLANYVSSCESISFASAQNKIERFVFSIQNDLEHKKEARLSKIGFLSVDINGIISFEPDLKINFLPDSFGLEAIQSPAILRKSKKLICQNRFTKVQKYSSSKTSFNWKIAAVLIPLIGLSTYVSFQQDAIGLQICQLCILEIRLKKNLHRFTFQELLRSKKKQ
ncbi:MAG: hypothetical protein CM15mP23_15070 [Cryomorphaceae bacterium]|nr:MAG: hypothetical protein CM15mP23_15070 [Cryomorphaceae bacterium]